jgi:Peptidase family M1 domain
MSKRSLLFATLVVCLSLSAFAAGPADFVRDLRTPTLGTPAEVSNLAITVGHMKLKLTAGSAAKITAGGETAGFFFRGSGAFEYVAEATEMPVVTRNVKSDSKVKLSGATISDEVTEVLLFSVGEPLPAMDNSGGAALADAFKAHQELWDRARIDGPSHVLAPMKFGLPGKVVYAEIVTPHDNLLYVFDSGHDQQETLASLRSPKTFVGDKTIQQWLLPTVLSSQPIGRDVKTHAKPAFTITAVDYTLVADGDNAKLEMTETIVPRVAGQQVLRFGLASEIFARENQPQRRLRVRSVTDDQGRAASADHEMDDLLVILPAPAAGPIKLKFVIDGDFIIREGGDNAWQLVNFAWFPQTTMFAGGSFTVHSVVKVKKPFVPIVPGNTIARREEGDYNVVENVIDKPVNFPVVHAGKYHFVEETRDGLTVRVAAYGMKNERGSKTLIDLAYGFINELEVFLGPFPWKEFNIVQVNTYGYGQAPPATMFITNEAFTPLASTIDQIFSQGINERFAHEIAHQYWFTVVKIPDIEENWISESFASISAGMLLKRLQSEAIYNRMVNTWKANAKQATAIAPIPYAARIGGDYGLAFAAYQNLLYNKGPYLLATIHKKLGDEKFLVFLKSYQKSFQWKVGSTKDIAGLLSFMTKEDWMPFFDQYYWGTALP